MIRTLLLASAVSLFAGGVAAAQGAQEARSLADLPPERIAADTTTAFNPRTGVAERIAPAFDPFEADETLAGEVRLRSAVGVRDLDNRPLSGGVLVDVGLFHSRSGETDPARTRDAVFLSGEPMAIVSRDTREVECSTRATETVYLSDRYYGGYAGYGGLTRRRPAYLGYGFGYGHPYGFNDGFGYGSGFGHRGYGDYYGGFGRYSGFGYQPVRPRPRPRGTDNPGVRPVEGAPAIEAPPARPGITRAPRVNPDRARVRRQLLERRDRSFRDVSGGRSGGATIPATTAPTPRPARPAPRPSADTFRPAPRAARPAQPVTRATPRSTPRPAPRPSSRPSSRPASRPAPRSSAPSRAARPSPNRSRARESLGGKRELRLFPNGRFDDTVVLRSTRDCAVEDRISLFVSNERLDAARFDGLAFVVRDVRPLRDGATEVYDEHVIVIPPNYIEGFRRADRAGR